MKSDNIITKIKDGIALITFNRPKTLNALNLDLNAGGQFEENAFALCFNSEDAKEGIHAFLEKREAVFTGKLK